MLSIDSNWADESATAENVLWTRAFWDEMQKHSNGRMYFNFPGLLEEGDALLRSSYGTNFDRLVALKNAYDPNNLFRLNQNIKPTSEHEPAS